MKRQQSDIQYIVNLAVSHQSLHNNEAAASTGELGMGESGVNNSQKCFKLVHNHSKERSLNMQS